MNTKTKRNKNVRPDDTSSSNAVPIETVGRIAHEINNPLDAAQRYVRLAMQAVDDQNLSDANSFLNRASDAITRVIDVSRTVLGHARKRAIDAQGVPVSQVIEEALAIFQDTAAGSDVVISAHYRDGQITTTHDTPIFQICSNLIRNALDAMPDGGRLTITTVATNLDIAIRFEDTGPGFGDEPTVHLQPFVSTKQNTGGTGLGLSICRDITVSLGGDIQLANRRDGGACVTVRLPVEPQQQATDRGGSAT